MAVSADSDGAPQPRPIPESLEAGLDLFAAAWLQNWAESGGSVCVDAQGKAQLGFPVYHDSPDYIAPVDDLPEWLRRHNETFRDGLYHGKMRALLDLIQAVPCGCDALKRHMTVHGMRTYFGPVGARS